MSHQSLAVKELLSPNAVLVVDMCGLFTRHKAGSIGKVVGQVGPTVRRRSTTDSVNVQLGLGDIMAGVGTKNATNRGPKAEMRELYARLHFSTVPYYSVLFRTACSCM
jgi:hypothetical protein